ncbi:putative thioredoxin [Microcella putealis]|uniref:Putative thioredoxin n=1 Tax=Microcella putealis TaxID=337005 RepID=A0A4Q7LSC8_9MICO|nr:tetratricopeptide repeat protein [Microcella putealis]RZS57594.1 putative thioredoxin [Microcella putealis]TQM24661.1 putative thioredoxin [Microcella putealis]
MTDASLNPAALRGAVDLSSLVRSAQQPSPGAAPASGNVAAASGSAPAGIVSEADDRSFGQAVELSRQVPVIVEFYGGGVAPFLPSIVESYSGRLALVTVDGNRSPQVAQAFQITQVPAVVALIGGRPVPLFVGMAADEEVRQVFEQVLELAAQNGVTGTVTGVADDDADTEPAEEPLPPLHQEAYDAVERGDLDAAITAFETAIAQNPRDDDAVAGLAQVSLLKRLAGADAATIRQNAAEHPDDAAAQLAIADLDVSGGHIEDAFARLLTVFPRLDAEGKAEVRARMLDFFALVGAEDPRVAAARRQLTNLLY